MTGGQPAPTSPKNLAGQPNTFDLVKSLEATGAKTVAIDAYDRKSIQKGLREALKAADQGEFTTLVIRGSCIKKVPTQKKGVRLAVDTEKCQRCHTCLICPGNEAGPEGFPIYNNLCSGCGDGTPACLQMCPFKAIEFSAAGGKPKKAPATVTEPPAIESVSVNPDDLPAKLYLAIRGVGGQGNLFFGRVLTQLAFLAGYDRQNIVKGETHGMAQMGGPVISTFACGNVHSPVLLPGQADCLICMEQSELLRPGFLDLLRPDGRILTATTAIVPQNLKAEEYPTPEQIAKAIGGRNLLQIDVLAKALAMGDTSGRVANVVMLGALSQVTPFSRLPLNLWLQAIKNMSPATQIWAMNYRAFQEGRALM
jgi:indolepyruvate ferredoxin oxidoreductase alpha subunit